MSSPVRETLRITASMVVACALGAGLLGAVYVGTERYARAAEREGERRAIQELLALPAGAEVTEVRSELDPQRGEVVYRVGAPGEEEPRATLVFALDGTAREPRPAAGKLVPLSRMFVASRDGRTAGFVVEGVARGYKNRIRFLVGVAPDFSIAGVRVLEHEEDPGLGAEIANEDFEGQFIGRDAASLARHGITRDPLPEDWRRALSELRRMPAAPWRGRHAALMARERERPVHAVTGATISSRALADGVRETVERFRQRWSLIEPRLGGGS